MPSRPRASRRALGILLLCAYPLLAHAEVSTGLVCLAWLAWLCLAALVYMATRGKWRAAACALMVGALLLTDVDALLRIPPVVINLVLAAWFGRSLLSGEEPVINWFARLERGELPPDLARYARRLTVIWTVFFVAMAAVAAALAAFATAEAWSLFANGINYVLVGLLFVGEYAYRRVRYRHYTHASLAQFVRIMFASSGVAGRRVGRR
ncbi:MAG: hypothetical protein WBM28_10490 [Burkholderiales bacterium]